MSPDRALATCEAAEEQMAEKELAGEELEAVKQQREQHVDKQQRKVKAFTCEHEGCGKCFTRSNDLTRHTRTHTGNQPFACVHEGCGKRFSMLHHLTAHERTHTGEQPFACVHEGCGKRFSVLQNLKAHERMHTGERSYVCKHEGCGKRFSAWNSLTAHERTHTEEAEALRARLARWREQQQPLVCQAAAKGPLPLLRLLDGFVDQLPARGISTALERALRFARRGLDSTDEPPDGDAESSVPSIADELEVSPSDDETELDETELDDGGAVFDEAAPELAEMSSPELMTSAGATEALGILGRLRPRLPLGKTFAAEVARLEVDLHRLIFIQATLAAAACAGTQDRETMPLEARARAEALRMRFVGRASVSEAVVAADAVVEEAAAAVEGLAQVEMMAARAAAAEAGRVCVAAACTLVRCERHTAYKEAAGEDLEQEALRARSPDDRMFALRGRGPHASWLEPSNPAAWKGIGRGAKALYGQYVRVPDGVALPAHLLDCPGCYVRLNAGDDIVAACQPFAQDIREHATRLMLDDADSQRIIALNMSACITVCGFFDTQSGARARIMRVECYGGDLEESASNAEHRASVKKALYNAMLPGHLYLQKYGHPGGCSWGMSLRGVGRGKLLIRAVELGGVEMGTSAWAETVALMLGMTGPTKPRHFHEPTHVGDIFTSHEVRLVL